ncbi:MAG: hypothetical protein AAF204_04285 [Pseudomonadota bacterium]
MSAVRILSKSFGVVAATLVASGANAGAAERAARIAAYCAVSEDCPEALVGGRAADDPEIIAAQERYDAIIARQSADQIGSKSSKSSFPDISQFMFLRPHATEQEITGDSEDFSQEQVVTLGEYIAPQSSDEEALKAKQEQIRDRTGKAENRALDFFRKKEPVEPVEP